MKLFALFLLVLLAVLGDLLVLVSALLMSTHQFDFWLVVLGHGCASALAAVAMRLLLPQRFSQPWVAATLLLFCFAFVAPVVGALGLLFITRWHLNQAVDDVRYAVPVSLALPLYDVQSKEQARGGQGAIRSRLGEDVPSDLRMQSLLTLQAVPSRVSNPILEDLLGDSTDDVRLVAFGMLDSEEKKISREIRHESERLTRSLTPEQRYDALRHLAELNWELVYACLAQGELRRHMLSQARLHADAALAMNVPPGSGLVFLRGRILLEQGDTEAARLDLERAMALGQSKTSALPYLAELAFRQRNFSGVRALMAQLSSLNLASQTRAVEDFWVKRDNEINFSDHKYLPHI